MQLPQKSESLSPQEISRELATLRSEMHSCGQERAGNYANILANSVPPSRDLDTAVFVRQLVTLLAEYPDKACDHVVKTYPRNHVTCSLKRVADALDEAKYEMESLIAGHKLNLRQVEERSEQDTASIEDARIAASWETPSGKKMLSEIKERVAKRTAGPLDKAVLEAHDTPAEQAT